MMQSQLRRAALRPSDSSATYQLQRATTFAAPRLPRECRPLGRLHVPEAATMAEGTGVSSVSQQESTSTSSTQVHPKEEGHEEKFVWTQHWWPVSPVDILDKERPVKHVILGKSLALWYNKSLGKFSAFEDRCPHRLAPLSQGRIVDDNLMCSYHGWQFGADGQNKNIPQLDKESQAAACGNKRACAVNYPTYEHRGVLYVWMDPSPEGFKKAETTGITMLDGVNGFTLVQSAADYASWVEQGFDFTHANFLHHGSGFWMEDLIPVTTPLPPAPADSQGGFYMEHMGYEESSKKSVLKRRFIPPYSTSIAYPVPGGQLVGQIKLVPVVPGSCRYVAGFSFVPSQSVPKFRTVYPLATPDTVNALPGGNAEMVDGVLTTSQEFRGTAPTVEASVLAEIQAAAAAAKAATPASTESAAAAKPKDKPKRNVSMMIPVIRFLQKFDLPHWVYRNSMIADQDEVLLAELERLAQQRGDKERKYHMPAMAADTGVAAVNKWLDKVGYPHSLFPPHLQRQSASWKDGEQVDVDKLLARGPMHVDYCTICQEGFRLMTKICWAVTAAAALTAGFAANLAALGVIKAGNIFAGDIPLLISSVLAVALVKGAQLLWDFRHSRFISGGRQWRQTGGLSLITVPDAN